MVTRRVLVVCTANVCRSAMAEALLRKSAFDKGLDLTVTSAGVRVPGLPVDPEAVRSLDGYGLDIRGHQPRQADRAIIGSDGADLVITMTREHVRDIVSFDRHSFGRTFSLPELVRRARRVRPDQHDDDWARWLAAVGEGRTARDLMTPDRTDDIEDPYGMSLAVHQRTAEELSGLVSELTEMMPR